MASFRSSDKLSQFSEVGLLPESIFTGQANSIDETMTSVTAPRVFYKSARLVGNLMIEAALNARAR